MTDTENSPILTPQTYPAKKKSPRALWLVGAAVLVAAVAFAVVIASGRDSLTLDEGLQDALLTSADFGAAYQIDVLDQRQLDEIDTSPAAPPSGIQPAECAELLSDAPQPTGDHTVAAVMAKADDTYFLEMVTPVGGVSEWDTSRIDQLVARCGTVTLSAGGQTGTVTFERLASAGDRSYALLTTIATGATTLYVAVSVAQVGDRAVVLVGGSAGDFDGNEFVRLAGAARDRAAVQL